MDALFGLSGLLGMIIFIVLMVISVIKKNGKLKKSLIGIGVSFALFVTGLAMAPPDTGSKLSGSAESVQAPGVTETQGKAVDAAPTAPSSQDVSPSSNPDAPVSSNSGSPAPSNTSQVSGKLKVHYIDVGQADSILIQDGNVNMLIDAGNNGDATTVVNYIKKQGISRLDYVVGTHPHEDHVGGLDAVIKAFEIGKIYMPRATSTTKTYEDVLNAVKSKGLKVTTPQTGTGFKLASADAVILAPSSSSYEDLNNHSIVIRLTFGSNSFLFAGDAEDVSENEMISKGLALSADVLKVGHHGSSSSTTSAFLSRVNPKYAVIMVGKGNTYGHPHKETMDKLKSKSIKVYRTDENGTIVATSDGKTVSFNVNPGSYTRGGSSSGGSTGSSAPSSGSTAPTSPAPAPSTSGKTYVDASGKGLIKGNISSSGEKIYHLPGGAYYDRTVPEQWFKTEAEAKAAGFRASSR